MPKTTESTIISTETTSSDAIITISKPKDAPTTVTTTTESINEIDLKPIIVNEMPSVSFFTNEMPFVLICEAENPSSSEVFFTKPIKYSWNKNGRPFTELNDPTKQIYSESAYNGNILFVAPTSPDDEGTYQCVAENQFGKSFSNAAVVMERRRHGTPRVLDPDFSPIKGEPIIEAVAENVPDFGLSREPKLVFYVYPSSQQETEDVEVINMLPAENIEPEILDQTESPKITAEKEQTINDIKNLLPDFLEESATENDGLEEVDENVTDVEHIIDELLDSTEGSGDVEIEEILNSDPAGEIDLRSS